MTNTPGERSVLIVGLTRGRDQDPEHVVEQAIRFAHKFAARLILCTVDPTHYEVRRNPDGSVVAWDIDPDVADEEVTERFEQDFARSLQDLMRGTGLSWELRALAGEPAHELGKLADELDAEAIVVGARKPGLRTTAHEFFNGSVAVHLAHRQRRPVIVIPTDPATHNEPLPYEEG